MQAAWTSVAQSAWFKAIVLSSLAFLAPAKPLFLGAIAMVAMDTVAGVWAAHRRGERVSSAGFRRTVSKTLVYTMAILATYVAEHTLLEHLVPITKIAAAAIGVVEAKSVLENLQSVLGMDLFKFLIGKLGSVNDAFGGPKGATEQPARPKDEGEK